MTEHPFETPLEIERTGDDTPAGSVRGYAWRMTGWHQVGAGLVAILVAGLSLAPVELQRRIVDDALAEQSLDLLIILGAIYLGVVVALQLVKFGLGLYQGWLGESTAAYTRRHLAEIHARRDSRNPGEAVSIIGAEVDKLAGFVGGAPSQAASNLALLLGTVAYFFVIEPRIALLSLVLLAPQAILTPFLQRRLNRLVEKRLGLMRAFGDRVSEGAAEDAPEIGQIFSNRVRFYAWKFLLKGLLNFLNALAPLTVLVFGGWLVIEGETTVGVLVAFVSGFERVSGPIRQLIAFYREAAQAEVQHAMIAKWM